MSIFGRKQGRPRKEELGEEERTEVVETRKKPEEYKVEFVKQTEPQPQIKAAQPTPKPTPTQQTEKEVEEDELVRDYSPYEFLRMPTEPQPGIYEAKSCKLLAEILSELREIREAIQNA